MEKRWNVAQQISHEFTQQFPDINQVILQLLHNRGMHTQQEFDEFLRSDWTHDVHDPFLFSNMDTAVSRIISALEKKELITIFGDYDADGVTGTSILYTTLKRLGAEHIDTYIPHREFEGYGLNLEAVEKIVTKGTKLIITVDLGVSNIEEIARANELGCDVIVVDHHEFRIVDDNVVLPDAHAIIHTRIPGSNYPFPHLCGAGTAFKLAQALLVHSLEEHEAFEKWLLDLVTIGTIADVVPLVGENRTLVKYGLMVLSKTQRVGLRKLIETARVKGNGNGEVSSTNHYNLSSWNVAFQIAPRINAAGRMSHAKEALTLLLTELENEAEGHARHLNDINSERQKITERMFKEALEQIGEDQTDHVLMAYNAEWPIGVVGLVAGKIVNQFYKPVILLTDAEGMVVGSGRSIQEFNLVEGLAEVSEHLDRFGGHAMACGMKLPKDNLDAFMDAYKSIVHDKLAGQDLRPVIDIEAEIQLRDISWDLVEALEVMEPFGEANKLPLFYTRGVRILDIATVGKTEKHLRISISDASGAHTFKTIGFNLTNGWKDKLHNGDFIDIVYELGVNQWNGNKEIQIKLKDLRKSKTE